MSHSRGWSIVVVTWCAARVRSAARSGLVAGLVVVLAACGRDSGTFTLPTVPTVTTPAPRLLRVIDGWTGAPVVGAVVRADTRAVVTTTADTLIDVSTCDRLSIEAGPGFLERHVYCHSMSLVSEGAISLWPVTGAQEIEETKSALFKNGRLSPRVTMPHYLEDAFVDVEGSREAWFSAAAEVEVLTRGAWRISAQVGLTGLDVGGDAVIVRLAGADPCPSWSAVDPVFHYCYTIGPGYFVPYLLVDRAFAGRRDLALRALLQSVGFAVGLLPGVTSSGAPTRDLSEVERKMLHMVGRRPVPTTWPDWEFP